LADTKWDQSDRGRRDVAVVADKTTIRVFTTDSRQQQTEVQLSLFIVIIIIIIVSVKLFKYSETKRTRSEVVL